MLLKEHIIHIFLILVTQCLWAQNFSADVKASSEKYYSMDKFSMSVEALIYNSTDSKIASQKIISQVKKSGESYKTTTPYVETLYNPTYVIAVSQGSQTIMYAPNDKKQPPIGELLPMIDSAMTRYDSVVYKGLSGTDKHYKVFLNGLSIKTIDVYIRPDFLFSKIEYTLDPKDGIARMEINFKDIETAPVFEKTEFATSHYLNTTNPKKIGPSKNYVGYKVIFNDFALRNKKRN